MDAPTQLTSRAPRYDHKITHHHSSDREGASLGGDSGKVGAGWLTLTKSDV
jgi:hypothetical protein